MFIAMVPLWMVVLVGLALALHGTVILWLRGRPTTPALCLLWLYGMTFGVAGWKAAKWLVGPAARATNGVVDFKSLSGQPQLWVWTVRFFPVVMAMSILYAFVLAMLFRKWTAPVIVLACAPVFAFLESVLFTQANIAPYRMEYVAGIGFHAFAMAALLAWALPAAPGRMREWRAGRLNVEDLKYCCRGCGYDLRGSEGDVCPECGRGIPVEQLERLRVESGIVE